MREEHSPHRPSQYPPPPPCSGAFGTTLSREYALAAAAFGLDEDALRALCAAAPGYTFLEPGERAALAARVERELLVGRLGNDSKVGCMFCRS